jgi:hypothetical protein
LALWPKPGEADVAGRLSRSGERLMVEPYVWLYICGVCEGPVGGRRLERS